MIFEGSITQKVFRNRLDPELQHKHHDIVFGLARIAAAAMFVYLGLQLVNLIHGQKLAYLHGGWGAWYALEVVGCVAIPMAMLLVGSQRRLMPLVGIGSALTMIGVILNRLNISVIAFKWYLPNHYVPSWMEFVVTAGVISAELWVFRWIVNRMPVLGFQPEWAKHPEEAAAHPALPVAPAARA